MLFIFRGSERSMPFDVGRTETLRGVGVCRPRPCSRLSTILRSCRVDHRKAARHPLRIEAPASVSGEHSNVSLPDYTPASTCIRIRGEVSFLLPTPCLRSSQQQHK